MFQKAALNVKRYIAVPVFAFIAHYTLAFHNNGLQFPVGSMINALIFVMLLLLFSKAEFNIKNQKGAFAISVLFALLTVIGAAVHPLRDDPYSPIIRTLFVAHVAGQRIIVGSQCIVTVHFFSCSFIRSSTSS